LNPVAVRSSFPNVPPIASHIASSFDFGEGMKVFED